MQIFFTGKVLSVKNDRKTRELETDHQILFLTSEFVHFICNYQILWQSRIYGHLPPITKTIQARRTRHAGHCWRSKDELISDVLLWTPAYGQAKAGRPARTYIQQLCEGTGSYVRVPEDLPEAINDREKWQERVRDIRARSTTWWWWWWWWWQSRVLFLEW